jgi:ferredoxin
MRVRVDESACQGHTLCWMAAPERFILDDADGHATAVDGDVEDDQIERIREAIRSCPERAISEL